MPGKQGDAYIGTCCGQIGEHWGLSKLFGEMNELVCRLSKAVMGSLLSLQASVCVMELCSLTLMQWLRVKKGVVGC